MGSRRERRLRCAWQVPHSSPQCHPLSHAHFPDTEGGSAPVDPLAALEKTTDAQNHLTKVQIPRLESLQTVSEHYNSDPYSLSLKVRKRFREEKKVKREKDKVDDLIKGRYGLPETLSLVEDDERAKQEAKDEWARGKQELELRENNKRRKLAVEIVSIPSSSSSSSLSSRPLPDIASSSKSPASTNALGLLRARILENTARQRSPFDRPRISTVKDSSFVRRK